MKNDNCPFSLFSPLFCFSVVLAASSLFSLSRSFSVSPRVARSSSRKETDSKREAREGEAGTALDVPRLRKRKGRALFFSVSVSSRRFVSSLLVQQLFDDAALAFEPFPRSRKTSEGWLLSRSHRPLE